jgi:hypothetical protein
MNPVRIMELDHILFHDITAFGNMLWSLVLSLAIRHSEINALLCALHDPPVQSI